MAKCKSIHCLNTTSQSDDFCATCRTSQSFMSSSNKEIPMSKKYPQYYKDVSEVAEVDVYAIHQLFNIQDPSGALQHASKKLLLSGVRTGKKSAFKDVQEARDTLTRWLQLNPEQE